LLIVLQLLQFGLVFLILWLAGYRDVRTLLYVIFLGIFLLSCFLVYHYVTRRPLYERLSRPMAALDESLEKTGQEPMAEALDDLLKSQYRLYEHRIEETEAKKEEHLTFIDRWVHQMKTPLSVIELTAQT